MSTRRQFMMTLVPAAAVLTAATGARAQAAKIDEKDPAAVALAYKHDATKVDAKANPTYKAGNNCLNCQFYQGKDAWGACPMVGGKLVAANRSDLITVTGDDKSTVQELIDSQVNTDPRRGTTELHPLSFIRIDTAARIELERQGLSGDGVPAAGRLSQPKVSAPRSRQPIRSR